MRRRGDEEDDEIRKKAAPYEGVSRDEEVGKVVRSRVTRTGGSCQRTKRQTRKQEYALVLPSAYDQVKQGTVMIKAWTTVLCPIQYWRFVDITYSTGPWRWCYTGAMFGWKSAAS